MKTPKLISFMIRPIVLIGLLLLLQIYSFINDMNIENKVLLLLLSLAFIWAVAWNLSTWKAQRDFLRQKSSTKPDSKKE